MLFILMTSTVSHEVKSEIFSKFLEHKDSDILARAVVEVIINMYVKKTSVINFAFASSSLTEKHHILEIIQEVVAKVDSKVTISIEDNNHMMKARRKRVFNVFLVDNYESFAKIVHNLTTVIYDFQGFYIIVITQRENSLKRIFEDLWSNYITNANVFTLDSNNLNEVNIFTYFPFTQYYCEQVEPILYNTYTIESGFKMSLTYFPKKVSNMYGCPVKFATFDFPPFSIIKTNDKGIIKLGGLDGILIKCISKQMNFTLDIVIVKDLWGTLNENGSSTGAMKMVLDGTVNSTIGTSSELKFRLLSSSHAYYTSSLAWMVPPGRELTSLNIIIKPFELDLWILVTAVFLISMLVVLVIKRCPIKTRNFIMGENVASPSLNIVKICLGVTLVRTPTRNFARTLLCISILYCIIIRCSYQGSLFKFMKMDNKEPIVNSFDEMLKRNYFFYMRHTSIEYVIKFPDVLKRYRWSFVIFVISYIK